MAEHPPATATPTFAPLFRPSVLVLGQVHVHVVAGLQTTDSRLTRVVLETLLSPVCAEGALQVWTAASRFSLPVPLLEMNGTMLST